VESEVGYYTTFTFWVVVKDPDEGNVDLASSHRAEANFNKMVSSETNFIDKINKLPFSIQP